MNDNPFDPVQKTPPSTKPGLGRGLDHLMQTPSAAAESKALAAGLRILVRGKEAEEAAPVTANEPVEAGANAEVEGEQERKDCPASAESPNQPTWSGDKPEASLPGSTAEHALVRLAIVVVLMLADIALVSWPVIWVAQHRHNATLLGLVSCVLSLMVAAGAGTLAVILWRDKKGR